MRSAVVALALCALAAVATADLKTRCLALPTLVCVLMKTGSVDLTGGPSNVSGTIHFAPAFEAGKCQVAIMGSITGLVASEDAGYKQGWHIHQFGDLTGDGDGKSTGGHFVSPDSSAEMPHGLPTESVRHWGDLGNLDAKTGTATFSSVHDVITLGGILGRGITVHADRDEGSKEQASGDAGARLAVGVIGYANPEML